MPNTSIDLKEKKNSSWTAIKVVGKNKSRKIVWLCRCDCGLEKEIVASYFTHGKCLSCICTPKKYRHRRTATNITSARTVWHGCYKDIDFDIFYRLSQMNCYYCGSPPRQYFNKSSASTKNPLCKFYYNGLDRVDNSLGHTESNCVPCCGICNFSKGRKSLDTFLSWADRFTKYHNRHSNLLLSNMHERS